MHQQTLPNTQPTLKPIERPTLIRTGHLDTGWHHHIEHQLIYAEGGVLYVLTEESQFLLPAYHGVWIPAQRAHKLLSPSEKTKLWLLYFAPKKAEEAVLKDIHVFGISPLAREMMIYTERWSTERDQTGTDAALAQSFYQTIRLLASEWCAQPLSLILPHTEDNLLGTITTYIRENMGSSLTIEDVAHVYSISGRTLMRLFRQHLGITFGTYLRIARIVKAVELLTLPATSVIDVAYAVGYNSPSAFSHAFRGLTGMTPQTYLAKGRSYKR